MFYKIAKIILGPILCFLFNIKAKGIDNLPKDKGFIICANHLNAIDPLLVAATLPIKISFLAKNELFKNIFLKFILDSLEMIPIKRGEADLKSIKLSLKALSQKKILGIFPEGTRNITGDLKAEPGVSMLAIRSKVAVVPVAIESNYKIFGNTTIYIGKPKEFDEYYNQKLNSDDYRRLSTELMKDIKNLISRRNNENSIR